MLSNVITNICYTISQKGEDLVSASSRWTFVCHSLSRLLQHVLCTSKLEGTGTFHCLYLRADEVTECFYRRLRGEGGWSGIAYIVPVIFYNHQRRTKCVTILHPVERTRMNCTHSMQLISRPPQLQPNIEAARGLECVMCEHLLHASQTNGERLNHMNSRHLAFQI